LKGQRIDAAERVSSERTSAHAQLDKGRLDMARGGTRRKGGMSEGKADNANRADSAQVIDPAIMQDDSQLGVALLHALRNAGVSVLYQDRELRTVWARNMAAPWMLGGKLDGENILSPAQIERIGGSRRQAIESGQADRFEISAVGEEDTRWFEIWVDPDYAEDGTVRGVITTKVETTERKHREQSLRALLREVSHRSRNLLAIIQSIASQTGNHAESIEDFLSYFQGRLQSLASSQDLITMSNWRGALFRDLVRGQLDRRREFEARRLSLEGSNPYLTPNAALHIGLALHELLFCSRARGALADPDGKIELTATLADDGDQGRMLRLVWAEPFTQPEQYFRTQSFGVIILERVVPASLDGKAELRFADDRVEYQLDIPHRNFEQEDALAQL
jgi:two-component sensor histidine kinase